MTCMSFADPCAGLKGVITTDGVWRIRKRERVPVLEVFKLEETGHGDILSPAFVEWRTKGLAERKEQVNGDEGRPP